MVAVTRSASSDSSQRPRSFVMRTRTTGPPSHRGIPARAVARLRSPPRATAGTHCSDQVGFGCAASGASHVACSVTLSAIDPASSAPREQAPFRPSRARLQSTLSLTAAARPRTALRGRGTLPAGLARARARRVVPAARRRLPRRARRAEPRRAARAHRRHARRPDPARHADDLRGRRGAGHAHPDDRPRRVRGRDHAHAIGFDEGITGWAARRREAALVNQAHLDPRVSFVPGTPIDPEALISIPLVARAQIKGVLNIYRVGEDGVFSRGRVRAREAVRRRRRARARQRADPRASSSTRRRPTRSPASSTTAASTSGC